MNIRGKNSRGFTVVELVVVISLLGILSVVAIGRISGPGAWYGELLATSLLTELRYGQQLALARADTQVVVSLHRQADAWRIESATISDGVIRNQEVDLGDTNLIASNGALIHTLAVAEPVTISFTNSGEIAALQLGAQAGSPDLGLQLAVTGTGSETLCLYNTGYASHAACR